MAIKQTKAGNASEKSSHWIFKIFRIIIVPTTIKAGAVAAPGTIPTNGLKNKDKKNKIATTIPVKPVLPPSETPEADSI